MSPFVHTRLPKVLTVHTLEIVEGRETEIVGLQSIAIKAFSKLSFTNERKIINSADVYTTVSKSVAKEIIRYCGVKKQINIIGNGVDIKFFVPKKDEAKVCSVARVPYVLYVGRLGYRKGLFNLVASAKYICEKLPEAYFILIGRGPLEAKLKHLVRMMNLDNNFSFLGFVSEKELLRYYQNAAIFILPSDYEGLPTTLLEAMACGLPVIATHVDGVPEVITDGINGFLVPKKDPKSIANAALKLLANTELRNKIGNNASERIKENNNWDIVCERVLNCYRLVTEPHNLADR
jgi:glycosyltransferase involved in cell wall biosynthesis